MLFRRPPVRPLVLRHQGQLGNRLFQYFFASTLTRRLRGAYRVFDLDIPELEIAGDKWSGSRDGFVSIEGAHRFDVESLVELLRAPSSPGATFLGYAMRLAYYDLGYCRSLVGPLLREASGFDKTWLVLNVRAGDILKGQHPDYRPLPLRYFEYLVDRTRLRPVFVGQIDRATPYGAALLERFPKALVVPHVSPRRDFLTLLGSKNLALPISSFSWLAAWLSHADTIHIPIAGLFDPLQRPDVSLLPSNDVRYRFHQLPTVRFNASPEQLADLYL